MLIDRYNRVHDYLRVSITDKCNLRCSYCNPVDLPKGYFAGRTRMSAAEIFDIVSVFVSLGVKKVRLTGGEPLVRKDARDIIEQLSRLPIELAITTNGVYLHEFIDVFTDCGLRSVNVSLDSLNEGSFKAITQRNEHKRVMDNIQLLLSRDFHVKVNMVVIKDVNHHEIPAFVEWTKAVPLHVRFIEFMPFSGNEWSSSKVFSHENMMELLSATHSYIKLDDEVHDTTKKYAVPGYCGTFAVISSMTQPFCSGCNRLRLTSDGKMKNCLFSKQEADILGSLRNGEDILPIIQHCVYAKEQMLGGQIAPRLSDVNTEALTNRSMISIGG